MIIVFIKQWWHCLFCMWRGGCSITGYAWKGRKTWTTFIGCTCGKVFWRKA